MAPEQNGAGRAPHGGGAPSARPVLLFDGVCALCNWTVRVVLRLDRRGRVRFAPLGGVYATDVLERHPEARGVDSLILVEPAQKADEGPDDGRRARGHSRAGVVERVRVKSDAILRLAHALGGVWRAAGLLRLVPRPLRDRAYDLVARHRYAIFGRLARRPDPPALGNKRFLD